MATPEHHQQATLPATERPPRPPPRPGCAIHRIAAGAVEHFHRDQREHGDKQEAGDPLHGRVVQHRLRERDPGELEQVGRRPRPPPPPPRARSRAGNFHVSRVPQAGHQGHHRGREDRHPWWRERDQGQRHVGAGQRDQPAGGLLQARPEEGQKTAGAAASRPKSEGSIAGRARVGQAAQCQQMKRITPITWKAYRWAGRVGWPMAHRGGPSITKCAIPNAGAGRDGVEDRRHRHTVERVADTEQQGGRDRRERVAASRHAREGELRRAR